MVEFTKLIENQNLISLAQKTILTQLGNLEPDTISNSGLGEEECVPCPQIETTTIQSVRTRINSPKQKNPRYIRQTKQT